MDVERFSRDYLPTEGETCTATVMGQHKRAALLFDRIWIARRNEPVEFLDIPAEVTFGLRSVDSVIVQRGIEEAMKDYVQSRHSTPEAIEGVVRHAVNVVGRVVAEAYRSQGIQVVPSYPTTADFRAEYPEGSDFAFQAAFDRLPLVDEANTPWDQILDFRNDPEAKRKYRDLRLWLRDDWKPRSLSEATDRLSQKIDDYEWAIKKHGFKTVSGALSAILDWKELPTIGATLLVAIHGGVAAASLVGGAILVGKCALWLGKVHMEKEEVSRGAGREIAYIYDASRRFTNVQA